MSKRFRTKKKKTEQIKLFGSVQVYDSGLVFITVKRRERITTLGKAYPEYERAKWELMN